MRTTSTRQARYKQVSSRNDDDDDGDDDDDAEQADVNTTTPNNGGLRASSLDCSDDDDADDSPVNAKHVNAMEIQSSESFNGNDDDDENNETDTDSDEDYSFTWPDTCTIALILLLQVPVLLGSIWMFYNLLGAWFVATPFALHLFAVMLGTTRGYFGRKQGTEEEQESSLLFVLVVWSRRICISFACIADIVLFGLVYPFVWRMLLDNLFTDVDGTVVVEWSGLARQLEWYIILAGTAAILRCLLAINAIGLRLAFVSFSSSASTVAAFWDESSSSSLTWTWCGPCSCSCFHRIFLMPFLHVNSRIEKMTRRLCSLSTRQKTLLQQALWWFVNSATTLAAVLFMCCIYSSIRHLLSFPPPQNSNNKILNSDCDGLDDTECWLPFPSFHFLQADSSTATGWRVHLDGKLLPPLKSGTNIHPGFLNELDGFSTMAPMMFYLPGLKEAHQAAAAKASGGGGAGQLKGWQSIADSTTSQSATLLLDVASHCLLAHSAEIDYLDNQNPLVLIFPAAPLYHNRHYAVALVNATDERAHRLSPTRGMLNILQGDGDTRTSRFDTNRTSRYLKVLIPALQEAADWFDYSSDPASLQLLFDFHTISEESQLGPVRAVRDATMQAISSTADWNWKDHVQTIQQIDYDNDCSQQNAGLARTVHAELDVPWFLEKRGPGARSSFLDQTAVDSGKAVRLGKSKFLVHIPCSVRAAALGKEGDMIKLSAVMEYGHGLFGTRAEAWDDFLVDMAHKEGFIITAMDWRGMSTFDLLVVAKVLISTPRQFQAVRDNLIQGYACKYALQHFSRHAILSMDWFRFDDSSGRESSKSMQALADAKPSYVFYGISQGGILGAGYTALSGVTGLIDRAVRYCARPYFDYTKWAFDILTVITISFFLCISSGTRLARHPVCAGNVEISRFLALRQALAV
jgi:hypothetical protein